jgi:hypothetical protein
MSMSSKKIKCDKCGKLFYRSKDLLKHKCPFLAIYVDRKENIQNDVGRNEEDTGRSGYS